MLADRNRAGVTAPTSPAARPAGNDALRDDAHFRAIVGHAPYPWQRRLYAALARGAVPDAVDIPTGLGKTASVLLALLARLENPLLPRRIVYVVDRRAIVDQTAEAVRAWIERIAALPALARAFDACASHPAERPVGLGVLRGGLADDGAWRLDPARPAVLVGTVDMVGSRLLFSGYGDGRSRRAMHAGLLGHDAMVLLDEAHLAPAFGALLRAVARLQDRPQFRAMTLSATGASGATVLGLTDADYGCAAVHRRLDAAKSPRFVEAATATERIRRIHDAAAAHRTGAVAVFVERVSDTRRIARGLVAALGPGAAGRVAVLTGTLRGHERAALAGGAVWRRFTPGRRHPPGAPSVYLVATAAGEVGVDLDADHAVMDLATLDSMIQRLGRVNRVGDGDAEVTVVFTTREASGARSAPTSYRERREAARAATLAVLRQLSSLCPRTLRALDPDTVTACCAPSARPAPLDAAVLEAFAATSAALPRPPVSVYLRGVSDEPDLAQCFVAWRRDVAELVALGAPVLSEVLAFFPPDPEELARVPASFARTLVRRAIQRLGGAALPLIVVGHDGEVFAAAVRDAAALPPFDFATVVLPTEAGGLSAEGLPDADAHGPVDDVGDTEERIRYIAPCPPETLPDWAEGAVELRVPLPGEADDGEERCFVFAKRHPDSGLHTGERRLSRRAASAPTIDAHSAAVAAAARRIATALGLPEDLVDALETAGRWHDKGKSRAVWQRAAGASPEGPALAKSPRGRLRPEWLGGYRHEFGSAVDAERALGPDVPHRDLVLHLVAAHHGWSRPGFPDRRQWDPEAAPRANEACARRAARRFARLEARHGPWRLAWLEALVKAADAYVSSGADDAPP